MKKILLGMLLLIFAVSCSQKPESTVSKFIDGIKRQKIEETYKKYALDNKSENDLKLEYNNKFQQLFFETLFKNIDYKIANWNNAHKIIKEMENKVAIFENIFGLSIFDGNENVILLNSDLEKVLNGEKTVQNNLFDKIENCDNKNISKI